jgi:GNAT superfamily N-acetyltransferase
VDPGLRLVLTSTADPAFREAVDRQIKAFNDAVSEPHRLVRKSGVRPLDIVVRDEQDRPLGGLVGNTYWDWLEIDDLWLPEALRGRGLGRELMAAAEAEAVVRGCSRAWVRTFSFQAREFYERLGYWVVGQLEDYPPGQTFYWLRKELSKQSLSSVDVCAADSEPAARG